jgi:hypothetical protein
MSNKDECQCGSCCSDEEKDESQECCCGDCDCGHDHGFHRRFLTKAEQIEELEEYQSELKLELQAVEEMLADLKK